jgi:cytochrome c peroxidase
MHFTVEDRIVVINSPLGTNHYSFFIYQLLCRNIRPWLTMSLMIRKYTRILFCITCPCLLIFLLSFIAEPENGIEQVKRNYELHLQQLQKSLVQFTKDLEQADTATWRADFVTCRREYKYAEYLIAYRFPLLAQRMNGPAIPEVEPADFYETGLPTGFQVLEEDLFGAEVLRRKTAIQKEIKHLLAYTHIIQGQTETIPFSEAMIYDALRMNLYTLAAKGISGFDSPVAFYSLEEGVHTLQAMRETLLAIGTVDESLEKKLSKCITLLQEPGLTFDGFDRAAFFIKGYNPLLKALYKQQQEKGIVFIRERRAVKTTAESFLAAKAFDPYFFAPEGTEQASPDLVRLGSALFENTTMSLGGRSCRSCHTPERSFTDGLVVNRSLQKDEGLMRNTPSLIYAALQPSLFYDVRASYLEQQAHDVLFNKDEMDVSLEHAIAGFKKDKVMLHAFSKAFPGISDPYTQDHIILALAAFQRQLPLFGSAFDRYMLGDSLAMNKQQVAGFNLFMGKAKCGTCHFMPLFNGAGPPFYDKIDSEILGVPEGRDTLHALIDKDLGAYDYFKNNIKKYAFKTPSIRNAARTAPYMHNGVYQTLEEVIDFYDRGGGTGLGIDLPNQTLPADRLNLNPSEKQALIAFINALSDQ